MVALLYKGAYHKISDILQGKVDAIENLIADVENKKEFAEKELTSLEKAVNEAIEDTNMAVQNAEKKAESISQSSKKTMEDIIEKKQKEYDEAIAKIKDSMSSEMKNKIVELISHEVMKILQDEENKSDMHNIAVEKSIEMLWRESENTTS
jgi:F0F1-type ATP synthase membrane subunit b/b'